MPHLDHLDPLERQIAQRRAVRTLATTAVLAGIGVAGTTAAGSLLVKQITGSDSLAGLTQTFSVLGAAFMALPLARVTSSHGRRPALAMGWSTAAFGMLVAVLGGVLRNVPLMLLGSLLGGAGAAAGYQARFGAVDLATNERRARDLSFVVWASTVGSVSGPNLLPWTTSLAASLGLPKLVGPYLFGSVMLASAAAFALIRLRPDPYVLARKEEAGRASHSLKASLALLRANHRARQAIAAVVIGHIAMVSVMVMTPVHMGEHSASLRIIGLVISVHVLGMYAFAPVMGWLSDRVGRLNVVRIGVVILLLSLLLSGLASPHDNVTLGIGLFLLGLGWSATLVAGSTMLSEAVEVADRPTAQGASDLLMNTGAAIGGAVAGVIIAVSSFTALNAVTAIPVLWLAWLARRPAK